ncbi:transcription antitermination factor NusB [Aquibacillus sp. 3ASR75-11]|uniref:Transcription antitermination protein NusB n=1 Tax=Terrihalobacillus insolitus TaxID=2950438 RepID=A0A9X3WVG7_9BACI|nr:transcription antitermination factor NusB [Terrihalobacillus insolitus]MDC3414433.1 transcription antitermination factor NusB [Terrihalobacillus insolitus]MDC3425313.1 transcription antitermination factor NusB [Terrihalobacillus insolitus]
MNRRTAREKAFQVLFQMDINAVDPSEALEHVLEKPVQDSFLRELVFGVNEKKSSIDQQIADHLQNWSLNRLASVEKTVLRIATYELLYNDEVPTGVAINEAVELAHKFGDEKSGKFINGVLSKMLK